MDKIETTDKDTDVKEKEYPWDGFLKTIVFAVLLALVVRSFLFEPFHIPSGSMKSNLLVGDYLFVSKYSYGYSRYSFPLGLPLFSGRVMASKPKRGDVVVFRYPPHPRIDYIKRVIGLPGDMVQVKEGYVYINGKKLERKRVADFSDIEGNIIETIPRFVETLPEGKNITILKENLPDPYMTTGEEIESYYLANNTPEYTVPEGHYFVMGDNRDNSRDSRFEVGFVPEENLVGRAEIIWFSTNGTSKLLEPFSWFKTMRIERFFKIIN
ncbi:MAG: signal peptidase I [Rickettsiales bacterium]